MAQSDEYLHRAEWLREELLEVELLDLQAGALVVLLQDLEDAGVGKDAPVHQHECLAMEIDKTLQVREVKNNTSSV